MSETQNEQTPFQERKIDIAIKIFKKLWRFFYERAVTVKDKLLEKSRDSESFLFWYKKAWQEAFSFSGRSGRASIVAFLLGNGLVLSVLAFILLFFRMTSTPVWILFFICCCAFIVLYVRRFHDRGHNAIFAFVPLFFFIALIPYGIFQVIADTLQTQSFVSWDLLFQKSGVGAIIAYEFFVVLCLWVIFMCLPSKKDNKYGEMPEQSDDRFLFKAEMLVIIVFSVLGAYYALLFVRNYARLKSVNAINTVDSFFQEQNTDSKSASKTFFGSTALSNTPENEKAIIKADEVTPKTSSETKTKVEIKENQKPKQKAQAKTEQKTVTEAKPVLQKTATQSIVSTAKQTPTDVNQKDVRAKTIKETSIKWTPFAVREFNPFPLVVTEHDFDSEGRGDSLMDVLLSVFSKDGENNEFLEQDVVMQEIIPLDTLPKTLKKGSAKITQEKSEDSSKTKAGKKSFTDFIEHLFISKDTPLYKKKIIVQNPNKFKRNFVSNPFLTKSKEAFESDPEQLKKAKQPPVQEQKTLDNSQQSEKLPASVAKTDTGVTNTPVSSENKDLKKDVSKKTFAKEIVSSQKKNLDKQKKSDDSNTQTKLDKQELLLQESTKIAESNLILHTLYQLAMQSVEKPQATTQSFGITIPVTMTYMGAENGYIVFVLNKKELKPYLEKQGIRCLLDQCSFDSNELF